MSLKKWGQDSFHTLSLQQASRVRYSVRIMIAEIIILLRHNRRLKKMHAISTQIELLGLCLKVAEGIIFKGTRSQV